MLSASSQASPSSSKHRLSRILNRTGAPNLITQNLHLEVPQIRLNPIEITTPTTPSDKFMLIEEFDE